MKCIKNGVLKCKPPKFCYTVNGACYKPTALGMPCTLSTKKKELKVPMVIDKNHLLFGPKKDIDEHVNFLNLTEKTYTSTLTKKDNETILNGLKTVELVSITEDLLTIMMENRD
jgi:hypothetical protein